jgi:hypothetical protein
MLKGSLVSLLAVAAATGCGDDSDNGDGGGEAGEGNSGGAAAGEKNTSGSANLAGETGSDGGTSPGSGGAPSEAGTGTAAGGASGGASGGAGAGEGGTADGGGAGPAPFGGAAGGGGDSGYQGPPLAKFCNTVMSGTAEDPMPTTLRLEIGAGVDKMTFTASSGECVPADGEACTEIPTGAAVLVSLFDVEEDTLPLDAATIEILQDEQLIFYSAVNEAMEPFWDVRVVNPTFACEDITYDDVLAIK